MRLTSNIRVHGTTLALTVAAFLAPLPTAAAATEEPSAETFAVHGQLTYVEQATWNFTAPCAGPNSLSPNRGAETADVTLYLGARLWPGAEGWIDGEVDQGFGLDNTTGV